MKPYKELTPIGKKRRLKKLATNALAYYDIDVKSVEFLAEETNIFYKVVDTNNKKYALKIFQEESSTIEDNLAEVFFINEVHKNTDITVPTVIYSKDDKGVIVIESEYFEIPKRVAIYNWIEGIDLDGRETEERFYKLGKITAKLHNATKNTIIPYDIFPKRWDKVFYYRNEVPVYKQENYQKYIDTNYHKVMDFIIPYLDKKLIEYYNNSEPQLIHADLNPWNIKLYKNEFRIIDFEEAMYGLPIHDFAIMLFYYRYDRGFDYEKVKQNFLAGYLSINSLPQFTDYDIDLLIIARTVNFLNYVLLIDDDPKEYCMTRIKRVEEFINKYTRKEYENYYKWLLAKYINIKD